MDPDRSPCDGIQEEDSSPLRSLYCCINWASWKLCWAAQEAQSSNTIFLPPTTSWVFAAGKMEPPAGQSICPSMEEAVLTRGWWESVFFKASFLINHLLSYIWGSDLFWKNLFYYRSYKPLYLLAYSAGGEVIAVFWLAINPSLMYKRPTLCPDNVWHVY